MGGRFSSEVTPFVKGDRTVRGSCGVQGAVSLGVGVPRPDFQ